MRSEKSIASAAFPTLAIGNAVVPSAQTSLWLRALKDYKDKTDIDLMSHPLASFLAAPNSPDSICDAFQTRMKDFRASHSKWGKFRNDYVKPIVELLLVVNKAAGEIASHFVCSTLSKSECMAYCAVAHRSRRPNDFCRVRCLAHGMYSQS